MPGTIQEEIKRIERQIETYEAFDLAEKARFNRESYLWTAEDRIEWQELQADNALMLRKLREERDALLEQLKPP
ncbi:hypothetical protein ACSHT2_08695 [Bradyrhizobium sp. PUT101]|uniref:hypothetical protein n=1 Tax=Bradyrhizobium sp. PUT101 TaxID=3447427 RepID=UPI003F824ACD